ncbi:hypothetical protein ACPW96_01185 [Micromonospora sp. DT81.3]|uniref:hypothetical protein n=1 Tax=Actinomycetes TaxID=1760 RepID=UPI003CE7C7F1
MTASRLASDAELLEMLEFGEAQSVPERAALLSRAAAQEVDPGALALGVRDGLILDLRQRMFGPTIEAQDRCPHCNEAASIEIDSAMWPRTDPARAGDVIKVRVGDYEVLCRPPRGADLNDVARASDPAVAKELLLEATVIHASRAATEIPAKALPPDVLGEIGRRLAEEDPLAEISLTVTCAACEGSWDTVLDPAQFVWEELRSWSRRVLWEVHLLAAAYGWTEREILALSSRRRQAYLGWVLGA